MRSCEKYLRASLTASFLVFLAVEVHRLVNAVESAIMMHEAVTAELPQILERQLNAIRSDALREIKDTRSDALSEIKDTRAELLKRLDAAQAEVVGHVELVSARADLQLSRANESLREMASLRSDLKPALDHAASIVARLDETSEMLLDCRSNGACLPSQTLALVGSTRSVLGQMAKATPELVVSAKSISLSVDRTTKNIERITRPQKPIWRIIQAAPWIGSGIEAIKGLLGN